MLWVQGTVRHGGGSSVRVGSLFFRRVEMIRWCIKRWGLQFGVQVCALGSFRI